jgi:hypothetical protein
LSNASQKCGIRHQQFQFLPQAANRWLKILKNLVVDLKTKPLPLPFAVLKKATRYKYIVCARRYYLTLEFEKKKNHKTMTKLPHHKRPSKNKYFAENTDNKTRRVNYQ